MSNSVETCSSKNYAHFDRDGVDIASLSFCRVATVSMPHKATDEIILLKSRARETIPTRQQRKIILFASHAFHAWGAEMLLDKCLLEVCIDGALIGQSMVHAALSCAEARDRLGATTDADGGRGARTGPRRPEPRHKAGAAVGAARGPLRRLPRVLLARAHTSARARVHRRPDQRSIHAPLGV